MWLERLTVLDVLSHQHTAVPFDRNRPLALFLGRNASGKCLPEGSPVALWSGRTKPIEAIRETDMLVGLDPDTWTFRPEHPLRMMTSGIQPVAEVTTASGNVLRCTANHRLLTTSGWVELGKLVPGQSIAVPLQLPASGDVAISGEEAMLLGLLLGDGTLSGRSAGFTNADPRVLAAFRQCAAAVFPEVRLREGYRLNPKTRTTTTTVWLTEPDGRGRRNYQKWLDVQGLARVRARSKRVPPVMFGVGRDTIIWLLAGLMSTDGWVSPHGEAEFYTVSAGLARDVRALLLRVGIPTTLRHRRVTWSSGAAAEVFTVNVVSYGRDRFVETVLPFMVRTRSKTACAAPISKSRAFSLPTEVVAMLTQAGVGGLREWRYRGRRISQWKFRSLLGRIPADAFGALRRFASVDIGWDPIVSIVAVGDHQTFDLAMPSEAFVAWDAVVHNSSTARALELALTGEVLDLAGSGLILSRLVRAGAAGGTVEISAQATPTTPAVTVRRRVGPKGVSTWINGSPTTKAIYDLFARIAGEADPAAVFRVLCNVSGFFALAPTAEEAARRQKALLLGLVDPSVPADTFPAWWPLAWGPPPATLAEVGAAHETAAARLTALRRQRAEIRVDVAALQGEPVTADLIAQIETKLCELRRARDERLAAHGAAAGQRAGLAERLAHARAELARVTEGQDLAVLEAGTHEPAHAIEERLTAVEAAMRAGRLAAERAAGQRAELHRRRAEEAARCGAAEEAARDLPTPAECERALAAAQVDREQARVAQREWVEQEHALLVLRARREALLAFRAHLQGAGLGPCPVCAHPFSPVERADALARHEQEIAATQETLARAEAALGPCPDTDGPAEAERAAEDRLARARAVAQEVAAARQAVRETDDALDALAAPAEQDPEGLLASQADLTAQLQGARAAEAARHWQVEIAEAEAALAALPAEDPEIAALAARIDKGEAARAEARERQTRRQAAERAQAQAASLDAEIAVVEGLREQLGPKGVRERLLHARLGDLTTRINAVLDRFGLALRFEAEPWAVLLNGQPPALMSETERWRAGLAVQVALAETTGARLLLADRVGNLDHANRAALFEILQIGLKHQWIEQAFLFATLTGETPPTVAPDAHVAVYHVVRAAGAWTTVARVA